MEKKTIFLELPCELIEKIDALNNQGDRSIFIKNLLEKQINEQKTDLTTKMTETDNKIVLTGKVNLVNDNGASLGAFNINTVEGFENLTKKIQEVSDDPMVRIKARRLL